MFCSDDTGTTARRHPYFLLGLREVNGIGLAAPSASWPRGAEPTIRIFKRKNEAGNQSVMMLHRVRLMLSRQRTQLSNSIRAHLSEFGIAGMARSS